MPRRLDFSAFRTHIGPPFSTGKPKRDKGMKKFNIDSFKTSGHFGPFGGRYVPEMLVPALENLEKAYLEARQDPAFRHEFEHLLRTWSGRPTPLYFASNLSQKLSGAKIYLKP